jgi:hypothetical protein
MAKKTAKKRKAARAKSAAPRAFRGRARAAGRKFVSTGDAVKVMKNLLKDLNEAKSGDTGWGWVDTVEAENASFLLDMTIKKLSKCGPSQSFPRTGS